MYFFQKESFNRNHMVIKNDKSLKDYETQIKNYINRLGLKDYKINYKEEGTIPLFQPINKKIVIKLTLELREV